MKTKLCLAFHFLYLVFFVYLMGNVLCRFVVEHDKIYLLFGTAAFVFLIVAIIFCRKRKMLELTNRNLNIIFGTMLAAMFLLQLYMIFALNNPQNTDSWAVNTAAQNYAVDGNWDNIYRGLGKRVHYFDRYTNNWAILIILGTFYRIEYLIFGSVKLEAAMIVNALVLQISNLFFYLTAKTIFKSSKKVLFSLLLLFVCVPFYTYTTVVYTDTFGMPFVMASIYFIVKLAKAESIKSKVVYMIATALTISIGYAIKGSIAVVLVAGIVYLCLTCDWKRTVSAALTFASVFLIINSLILPAYVKSCGIVSDESLDKYRFPATHWVMMGFNGEGKFYDKARHFTGSFPDYESKKEANIREIKKSLSRPSDKLLDHFNKKISFTWADGSFRTRYYIKEAPNSFWKRAIMNKKGLLNGYMQTYHVLILISMLISIITAIITKDKSAMILIRLSLFGLAMFLMIWETNPRYIFSFLPLIILMSSDGIFSTSGLINNKFFERKTQ